MDILLVPSVSSFNVGGQVSYTLLGVCLDSLAANRLP